MDEKTPSDFTKLAVEALDLWQEHLTTLATDPKAKADLAMTLEPSRQLFAEWIKKAQDVAHATASAASGIASATDGTSPLRASSDDGALRLSQLALHVAELEKRVAKLEARKSRAAGKTSGASQQPE